MNYDELNDAILVGIIKTLTIMKEVKSEGDDLNTVNFDEVIEQRRRDMVDPSLLECYVDVSDENLKTLTNHLKGKEFGEMRKWVVNNLDNDPVKIFRRIYDSLYTALEPATIPHAVLIIADYQYKSAFVADQEINLVACLTELMSQVKFK